MTKEESIVHLQAMISKPGGKQAARFLFAAAGIIPHVGGGIAGLAAFWAEREQLAFNKGLVAWASQTNADISEINNRLDELSNTPSPVKLSLLFGSLFGDALAEQLLNNLPQQIHAMLHPSSLNELEPYIDKGWLAIKPTHSIMNLGAGNRIGDCVEELKRPYGMGNGFILTINDVKELQLD